MAFSSDLASTLLHQASWLDQYAGADAEAAAKADDLTSSAQPAVPAAAAATAATAAAGGAAPAATAPRTAQQPLPPAPSGLIQTEDMALQELSGLVEALDASPAARASLLAANPSLRTVLDKLHAAVGMTAEEAAAASRPIRVTGVAELGTSVVPGAAAGYEAVPAGSSNTATSTLRAAAAAAAAAAPPAAAPTGKEGGFVRSDADVVSPEVLERLNQAIQHAVASGVGRGGKVDPDAESALPPSRSGVMSVLRSANGSGAPSLLELATGPLFSVPEGGPAAEPAAPVSSEAAGTPPQKSVTASLLGLGDALPVDRIRRASQRFSPAALATIAGAGLGAPGSSPTGKVSRPPPTLATAEASPAAPSLAASLTTLSGSAVLEPRDEQRVEDDAATAAVAAAAARLGVTLDGTAAPAMPDIEAAVARGGVAAALLDAATSGGVALPSSSSSADLYMNYSLRLAQLEAEAQAALALKQSWERAQAAGVLSPSAPPPVALLGREGTARASAVAPSHFSPVASNSAAAGTAAASSFRSHSSPIAGVVGIAAGGNSPTRLSPGAAFQASTKSPAATASPAAVSPLKVVAFKESSEQHSPLQATSSGAGGSGAGLSLLERRYRAWKAAKGSEGADGGATATLGSLGASITVASAEARPLGRWDTADAPPHSPVRLGGDLPTATNRFAPTLVFNAPPVIDGGAAATMSFRGRTAPLRGDPATTPLLCVQTGSVEAGAEPVLVPLTSHTLLRAPQAVEPGRGGGISSPRSLMMDTGAATGAVRSAVATRRDAPPATRTLPVPQGDAAAVPVPDTSAASAEHAAMLRHVLEATREVASVVARQAEEGRSLAPNADALAASRAAAQTAALIAAAMVVEAGGAAGSTQAESGEAEAEAADDDALIQGLAPAPSEGSEEVPVTAAVPVAAAAAASPDVFAVKHASPRSQPAGSPGEDACPTATSFAGVAAEAGDSCLLSLEAEEDGGHDAAGASLTGAVSRDTARTVATGSPFKRHPAALVVDTPGPVPLSTVNSLSARLSSPATAAATAPSSRTFVGKLAVSSRELQRRTMASATITCHADSAVAAAVEAVTDATRDTVHTLHTVAATEKPELARGLAALPSLPDGSAEAAVAAVAASLAYDGTGSPPPIFPPPRPTRPYGGNGGESPLKVPPHAPGEASETTGFSAPPPPLSALPPLEADGSVAVKKHRVVTGPIAVAVEAEAADRSESTSVEEPVNSSGGGGGPAPTPALRFVLGSMEPAAKPQGPGSGQEKPGRHAKTKGSALATTASVAAVVPTRTLTFVPAPAATELSAVHFEPDVAGAEEDGERLPSTSTTLPLPANATPPQAQRPDTLHFVTAGSPVARMQASATKADVPSRPAGTAAAVGAGEVSRTPAASTRYGLGNTADGVAAYGTALASVANESTSGLISASWAQLAQTLASTAAMGVGISSSTPVLPFTTLAPGSFAATHASTSFAAPSPLATASTSAMRGSAGPGTLSATASGRHVLRPRNTQGLSGPLADMAMTSPALTRLVVSGGSSAALTPYRYGVATRGSSPSETAALANPGLVMATTLAGEATVGAAVAATMVAPAALPSTPGGAAVALDAGSTASAASTGTLTMREGLGRILAPLMSTSTGK